MTKANGGQTNGSHHKEEENKQKGREQSNKSFWNLGKNETLRKAAKSVNILGKNEKKEDPSEVVIDEFIGQSLPLIFIVQFNIYEVLLAFCAFRIFDIFKIYPVNKAENLKGANGVILDDIVAGIYSLILVMIYKIIFSFNV